MALLSMELLYRIAADAIVVVHFAYVAFIVLGLLAILVLPTDLPTYRLTDLPTY